MTALMLLAALFGLCWAGRSRRVYRDRYITEDVDIYDASCSSDSCDSYDTSPEDRDD